MIILPRGMISGNLCGWEPWRDSAQILARLPLDWGTRSEVRGSVSKVLSGNLTVLAENHRSRISSHGREFVLALWEFIAFIANSLVFLLIGLTVAGIPFGQFGFTALVIVIALILLGRALTVYPLCLLFAWSRHAISIRAQHVLWWGGLRGALALALALSLPTDLAFRGQILIATFGVVAFSVIAQGLTMPPLLRITGFVPKKRS